jgi:hypothetical protein
MPTSDDTDSIERRKKAYSTVMVDSKMGGGG